MILVDILLGARAEFVNAWSVVQRIAGQSPTAGDSLVYQSIGATGEFFIVLLVNLVIGAILTTLCRPWLR